MNDIDVKGLEKFEQDLANEFWKAVSKYPPFNSCHEGYAVLLEEVDELWDHVKVKQGARTPSEMYKECVQIAAMAMRFAVECCTEEGAQR